MTAAEEQRRALEEQLREMDVMAARMPELEQDLERALEGETGVKLSPPTSARTPALPHPNSCPWTQLATVLP